MYKMNITHNSMRLTTPELLTLSSMSEYSSIKSQKKLTRADLMLLDYKQFKAARTIQRFYRGWRSRRLLKKRIRAANSIQVAWRSYARRKHKVQYVEELIQSVLVDRFNSSAIKIQALFRGWLSRKYLNNMCHLKTIQQNAIEDLLYAMAFELNVIKLSGDLPGVRTFTERCKSELEDMNSTLAYRLYNNHVARRRSIIKHEMAKQSRIFNESYLYTKAPFCGCDEDYVERLTVGKIYDNLEYDIIQNLSPVRRKSSTKQNGEKILKEVKLKREMKLSHFCRDMIKIINSWDVWKIPDKGMTTTKIDAFINDLNEYMSSLDYFDNCYCLPIDLKQYPNPSKL